MSDRNGAGDDAITPDPPGWEHEHAVDHADYLDALLDPDDPLHDVARKAAESESPNGD